MMSYYEKILLVLLCLALGACASTRVTTTPRTPIEQALITQAVQDAIYSLPIDESYLGKKFFLNADQLCEIICNVEQNEQTEEPEVCLSQPECYYIVSTIRQHILTKGLLLMENAKDAEIIIFPRIHYAGIDDSKTLIGLPAIPIPLPGVGTLETPEIALFSRTDQRGRASFTIYGADKATGRYLFEYCSAFGERYYTRWSLLLFFGWRTTSLEKPF